MARKVVASFITAMVVFVVLFWASLYHHIPHDDQKITAADLLVSSVSALPKPNPNHVIREGDNTNSFRDVNSVSDSVSSVSILLAEWEVLVIVSPDIILLPDFATGNYTCLFPNNDISPAKPAGVLPSPDRATFKCDYPVRLQGQSPFLQPILTKSPNNLPQRPSPAGELLQSNFLVYDSLSTEDDVILFAKGINNRQDSGRPPKELRCVFGDGGVRTAVTSSLQEVFRCQHPRPNAFFPPGPDQGRIKVSLEIVRQNQVVPSVAYYTPVRKVVEPETLLCACTMVYNVAKFLKEWVLYNSAIGVDKFILYDNGSDDDLGKVVKDLVEQGYNVTTVLWPWPKTQEAGFSHSSIYAKPSCKWMMYADVDEFVYSPSWLRSRESSPGGAALKSLLPKPGKNIGQLSINCLEFGPSNQASHPAVGVVQGYNCRRRAPNRHKSILLLDAVGYSLANVIHHFQLKKGYHWKNIGLQEAVVNHYKFQAWSEFKTKFRRRVSAYVVDWKQEEKLESKDRTPGLGYKAVEPRGWPEKFCDVHDDRLKDLTRRWFGVKSPSGYAMAWQR